MGKNIEPGQPGQSKECEECGIVFVPKRGGSQQRFCTPKCGQKSYHHRSWTNLERRQRHKVTTKNWELKNQHPCMDCGKLCSLRAKRCKKCATHIRRNFKGGRIIHGAGYILILRPEHPHAQKSGYIMEHIVAWEEANRKPLPKGWVIHHLNGIKSDNRPGNLLALPDKKHRRILEAKAKRIQELESLLNGQAQML